MTDYKRITWADMVITTSQPRISWELLTRLCASGDRVALDLRDARLAIQQLRTAAIGYVDAFNAEVDPPDELGTTNCDEALLALARAAAETEAQDWRDPTRKP